MSHERVAAPHTGYARFMDACYHRQPDATPIWFMRQGGSCIREYRALLEKYDVLTIAKTPELSSRVAIMPINNFGVDASVLYADVMLPVEAMGVEMHLEETGPVVHQPIRGAKQVEQLLTPGEDEVTPFVMDGIRLIRHELGGKQAIIGITGAPFTLACYMIEGRPSRDYRLAKALMYGQPAVWHELMMRVTDVLTGYVIAQVKAGADAIQMFDSWIGSISPSVYQRFVQPYSRRVLGAVKQAGAPSIHFGTGTGALLKIMTETGGDIIGVDWRVDLDDAWAQIGFERGMQGNLDPTIMQAPWPVIEEGARDVLRRAANRPGHIFNFGHAVGTMAEPDQLRRLVDTVHELTQR